MKILYLVPAAIALAACDDPAWQLTPDAPAAVTEAAAAAAAVPVETLDPTPPPPPPPAARTVEEFDTTTAEDRAEALAPVETSGETALGTTNVSLGSPADPGIWIETGLVTSLVEGRIENPNNGKSVNLELRPSGGPATAGSELSLAAMRLLDISLTDLVDVQVYSN